MTQTTKLTQLKKRIEQLEAKVKDHHIVIAIFIIFSIMLLLSLIIIDFVSATNLNIIIYNNTANFTYKEISNKISCNYDSTYTIPLNTQSDLWNFEIENIKLQSNCIAKSDYDNCVLEKSKKELEITAINNNYNALEKENNNLKERKCYSLNDINNRDKIILILSIISIILFILVIFSKLRKTIIVNHEVKK